MYMYIWLINCTYLYHHTVVLDRYTHCNIVHYKHNGVDETFEYVVICFVVIKGVACQRSQ